MNSFFLKNNLKPIQKICISGLFVAVLVILNKVLAINYIPIIPFVRVTFGAGGIAIFASFLLGPLYGGIVVAASDVLGYLIFDPKTFGFFPTVTLIYLLLGILPYFIFCFVKYIKSKKLMGFIQYFSFLIVLVLVSLFLIFNDSLTLFGVTYDFELYEKIILISVLGVLFLLLVFLNVLLDKKVNKNNLFNVYQISFICFISELLIFVLFGSLMKSIAFGFDMFLPILISQGILMFINIPINTYLILLILKITKRYIM